MAVTTWQGPLINDKIKDTPELLMDMSDDAIIQDSVIAKHTLSLSPDYVLTWGVWEAVRELLQNAIDQHTANPHSQVVFEYSDDENFVAEGCKPFYFGEKTVVVGATQCKLEPSSLLLGKTTKALDAKMVGQFGEGYKLALLVLTRLSYKVTIHNGDETWHPAFEWSDEYKSEVLTIERRRVDDSAPGEDDTRGVFFEIEGIDENNWGKITERYLGWEEPHDTILDAEHLKGKIFVSGLYVCELDGFEKGYNFKPGRIPLDRDRCLAPRFDVAIATARLWERSGDDKARYDMMESDAPDTEYCSVITPDTGKYFVERFQAEHGGAVPVYGEKEAERLEAAGTIVKRVPAAFRNTVRNMGKFVFNRSGTPTERLQRFKDQFGPFSGERAREFDAILEASLNWKGPGGVTE